MLLCVACAAPMLTAAKKKEKKQPEEVAAVKADTVLTDSIAKLHVTIDSLHRERDFFKQYYVKEVKKRLTADRAYMDGPFAHIDTLRLADIARQYAPCPDVPEFAKMTERISVLRSNLKTFAAASALVAADGPDFTPALPHEVDSLLKSIKQPLSARQAEEVDELSGIAGLYADAVEKFKARINNLRATVLTPGTCKEASGNAEFAASFQSGLPGYFDQGAVKNDYRYRISKVPRLKALYDEWQELLTKDFLNEKVAAIEERVLSFGKEEEAAEPAPIQTAEPAEPTQAPAEEPLPEVGNKADDTAAPAEATEDALDDENKDGDKDDEEKAEDEDDDSDEGNEKDNEEEQNED